MLRRPPRSTRTDTLFPYTTLFRSGELDRRGVDRNAVAIELVMEVRAGRKAGRADIADNFPLLHTVATVGGDPAHMGIARHQAALMLRSDERRVGKECVITCRFLW